MKIKLEIILVGIIFILTPNKLLPQNYYPFVNTNKMWSIVNNDYFYYPGHPASWNTWQIKFEGDTLIGEQNYLHHKECTDSTGILWQNIGFIREENNQVFYKKNAGAPNHLLYDFNLETNDSSYHYVFDDSLLYRVDSTGQTNIFGDNRKTWYITFDCGMNFLIIEGYGFYPDPFPQCICITGCLGYEPYILCYHENNIQLYQNPSYNTCFYENYGTNKIQTTTLSVDTPYIFNKYSTQTLNITINSDDTYQIKIFDITGKNKHTSAFIKETIIDIADLNAGIYIITIQNEKNIFSEKFIKYQK